MGAVTTYTFTDVTADHTIAASFAIDTYTITASAGPTGPSPRPARSWSTTGADQTFTITPAAGYHVADVLVDGVIGGRGDHLHLHRRHRRPHHRRQLRHRHLHHHRTSAGANGSITPAGTAAWSTYRLSDQAFTITPAAGYHVADVLVDGVAVGAVTSYTFTDVTANHTIAASFAIDTYTITGPQPGPTAPSTRAGTGGVVSELRSRPGLHHRPADRGYHVADVAGGRRLGGRGDRLHLQRRSPPTTPSPPAFAIDTYTITGPAGPTAPSTPAGTVGVVNVTGLPTRPSPSTPDPGYHVADVTGGRRSWAR